MHKDNLIFVSNNWWTIVLLKIFVSVSDRV